MVWFIFAITVSNNFSCKQIILESYKLSTVYTSRIILFSELEKFKINESNFFIGTQKTNQIHDGNVKKKEPFDFVTQIFGFIQPTCYASIVNKTELRKHSEKNVHTSGLFLVWQNILTFIKDVEVVIQSSQSRIFMKWNNAMSFMLFAL